MQPADNPQPFPSFYDHNPPRTRQPSGPPASIWAPQPQQSESTWPKALDSFSRVADREFQQNLRPDPRQLTTLPVISREDVFGPVDGACKKEIGAIGDGRKKNSPDFDDTHVEQLLRTLNLNSPAPCNQRPSLNLSFDTSPSSPDFSPASVTSALLTPTDLSPARSFDPKLNTPYEFGPSLQYLPQSSLLFEPSSPSRALDNHLSSSHSPSYRPSYPQSSYLSTPNAFPFFEPFSEHTSPAPAPQALYNSPPHRRPDPNRAPSMEWRQPQFQQQQEFRLPSEWLRHDEKPVAEYSSGIVGHEEPLRSSFVYQPQTPSSAHEPINFLSLLHPSSSPPYPTFVARIIKSSDQQASIFLQQKLKVAELDERAKIVDAICARGFEMMAHRFGNWAVQRCLEAASTPEERRKIVACMRGRIVDLATNCYGCHVLQKALDCEEDIRLLIVSELLLGDPAQTLVNKHASHVWSKIMELTWTPPAPPIFAYVNKSLKGKWAALACHETGSLVVQHAFENLEDEAKDGIVDELLNQGAATFSEVAKSQWGSYCIQHILEHGSDGHRQMTLDHLIAGLLEYATNEQGSKSVTKALKEGGKETLDRVVKRMCEPAKGARRAMIVDLALSVTGSQLIASTLPTADKDQRALLYECIRGHIVTLRGCKTGSKVIWLFDRMVRPVHHAHLTNAADHLFPLSSAPTTAIEKHRHLRKLLHIWRPLSSLIASTIISIGFDRISKFIHQFHNPIHRNQKIHTIQFHRTSITCNLGTISYIQQTPVHFFSNTHCTHNPVGPFFKQVLYTPFFILHPVLSCANHPSHLQYCLFPQVHVSYVLPPFRSASGPIIIISNSPHTSRPWTLISRNPHCYYHICTYTTVVFVANVVQF